MFPVGLGVGGVLELAGGKAVRRGRRQLARLGDGPLHTLGPLGQHQLGPVGRQQPPAFHAHGVGHGEDDPVAPGGGQGRQADAGVAAGRLDDDRLGRQLARSLGRVQHGKGDAVLDAARGVKALNFSKQSRLQTVSGGVAGEGDQGGVAHQLAYILIYSHGISSLSSDRPESLFQVG